MNLRIVQLFAHFSQIHLHLLLCPRHRLTIVSEQPHRPTFQSGVPMAMLKVSGLLEYIIPSPRSEGNLILFLMHIHKPGFFDCVAHRFVGSE